MDVTVVDNYNAYSKMNLNFVMSVSIIGIMSIPAILILYYGTSWSYLRKEGTVKFFSIE